MGSGWCHRRRQSWNIDALVLTRDLTEYVWLPKVTKEIFPSGSNRSTRSLQLPSLSTTEGSGDLSVRYVRVYAETWITGNEQQDVESKLYKAFSYKLWTFMFG